MFIVLCAEAAAAAFDGWIGKIENCYAESVNHVIGRMK